MGYFPSGTEGMSYQAAYCDHCVHQDDPCAVWEAHLLKNYAECNQKDSILHLLIPRDGLTNQQCRMFHAKPDHTG